MRERKRERKNWARESLSPHRPRPSTRLAFPPSLSSAPFSEHQILLPSFELAPRQEPVLKEGAGARKSRRLGKVQEEEEETAPLRCPAARSPISSAATPAAPPARGSAVTPNESQEAALRYSRSRPVSTEQRQ